MGPCLLLPTHKKGDFMYLDLTGFEPKWYDLVYCPQCSMVVTSYQDLQNNEECLVKCQNCDHEFTFLYDPTFAYPRIQVRPVLKSLQNIIIRDSGEIAIVGKDQKRIYLYCFMDWENFESKDGKILKLTLPIKEAIYDQAIQGIATFILSKSRQFEETKKVAEKNL